MAKCVLLALALIGMAAPANPETRQLLVSVTPRAAAAQATGTEFGLIPYVLRVEGLRLPGDRSSKLTIYGETPSKDAPVLGTAQGMGWTGGPKLNPPYTFVIPLSQEARRYLAGKQQVKLWIQCEGLTELRYGKVVADISEAK
jgi:hypothetical protein